MSAAQEAAFEIWLNAVPGRREHAERLRAAWVGSAEQTDSGDVDAAWGQLAGAMPEYASLPAVRPPLRVVADPPHERRTTVWLTRSVGVAAALAAAIVLAVGLRVVPGRSASGSTREYVAAAGERLQLTLMDGTALVLAPASRVRVPVDYGRGTRDVILEGEAYFTVVHDPAHPFAVHARDAVARDIGTRFDVRAYPGDHAVRVAVEQGEVAVGRAGAAHDQPVQAGEFATIVDTAVAVTQGTDLGTMTAWTAGRLVFSHTPLRDAVRELGRWYDLDVEIASSAEVALGDQRVTAAYTTEPASDVIEAIAATVGARVRRRGRVVTFTTP